MCFPGLYPGILTFCLTTSCPVAVYSDPPAKVNPQSYDPTKLLFITTFSRTSDILQLCPHELPDRVTPVSVWMAPAVASVVSEAVVTLTQKVTSSFSVICRQIIIHIRLQVTKLCRNQFSCCVHHLCTFIRTTMVLTSVMCLSVYHFSDKM